MPQCSGVRVDSWIERGTTISPHYDSLLAKLMVFAQDRPAAVQKMSAALAETQVGLLQTSIHMQPLTSLTWSLGSGMICCML